MKQQIDDLFFSFNKQSDKVRVYLSDILAVVTSGRIPSTESMTDLNDGIADLKEQYDFVYEAAKKLVPSDELPVQGVSLEDVMLAVKDSQSKRIAEQLAGAKNILNKFVSIKSEIQEYAQALASYQKNAERLLKEISEDTIDDLLEDTEAPALFIDAMESIHTSEWIELMKKVGDHYPEVEIQYGLAGGKFYYDNLSDNEPQTLINESDRSFEQDNFENELIGSQTESLDEYVEEDNNKINENDMEQDIRLVDEPDAEENHINDTSVMPEEGTLNQENSNGEGIGIEDDPGGKNPERVVIDELGTETEDEVTTEAINKIDTEPENSSSDAAEDEDSLAFCTIDTCEGENIPSQSEEENTLEPGSSELEAMTAQEMLDLGRTPSDEEFCNLIHSLLSQTPCDDEALSASIVQAGLLATGAALEENRPLSKSLSVQLQLATNVLRTDDFYNSTTLSNCFSGAESDIQAIALSAYMLALLQPETPYYDYGLQNQADNYRTNFDSFFPELCAFKNLLTVLINGRQKTQMGFTPSVIALLGNEDKKDDYVNNLKNEARKYLVVNQPKTRMKALPILYGSEFGEKSDLYYCMEVISNGKTSAEDLEMVEDTLEPFCDRKNGIVSINDEKIGKQLDKAWEKAYSKNNFMLDYSARAQAIKQYKVRLEVMCSWVESNKNQVENQKELGELKTLRKDIIEQIDIIKSDDSWTEVKDANVLRWILYYIPAYLNDEISPILIYKDILNTGVFSLSEDGIPEIDHSLAEIKYYEIWRNALRHIVAPRRKIEEITDEILGDTSNIIDEDKGLKDNFRQLMMIGKLLGSDNDDYVVTEQQIKEGVESAGNKAKEFENHLEMAYAYNRINETEKENLVNIMRYYKDFFYEIHDFACWRRFLDALEKQILEYTYRKKEILNSRLQDKIQGDETPDILKEAIKMMEEDSNFAVAEEYLNRYESGESKLEVLTIAETDYFKKFLSDEIFRPIFNECKRCKGLAVKSFGSKYFEKNLPKEWTSRLRANSKNLISKWPTRKDNADSDQVVDLFKGLGLSANRAKKVKECKVEHWQIEVTPAAKSEPDYVHPIAMFGTQMRSPLNAIFLYGNYTENEIVNTVTSLNLGGMSIVLIDRFIDAAERRQIGEIFHTQKSGQNPFLLIDQVLFLYLAGLEQTERLSALLKCTLPYATYQPFVRDAGSIADEMFCGRQQELATIIDHNGACVVYGGRQLGKTALLQRAESRCSIPEQKQFAVLSSIINYKTEEEVARRLVSDINGKTEKKIKLKPCSTIREMCEQLDSMFRNGQIVSMHLFIDEADAFLGAIADDAYRPIQPLVDLRRETKNNFKFVIAGLHNVCRAKNATKNNGIFGQLGTPLCIKPLSPRDAYQLLAKPLMYLGFNMEDSRSLETILTNTNYYPGILQFLGYILVETLSGQYSKYYSAVNGNPPFTLLEEQLGAIMSSSDLNNSIKEKFRWSLELDPRYFMVARCITMLHLMYEDDKGSGSWQGFSVDEITSMAESYEIHCLEEMSKQEYVVLLDEMVEMGILGKSDDRKKIYRLRKNSFVAIIGEDMDDLEKEINDNNV